MPNSTCKWPGCDTIPYGRGFCKPHHHKSWRVGHIAEPWLTYEARQAARVAAAASQECRWPECAERKIKAYALCISHYRRAAVIGDMSEPWKLWRPSRACESCGAQITDPVHNQRFCSTPCFTRDYRQRNLGKLRVTGRENSRRRHAQKLSTQVDRFTDKDVRDCHGDDCYLCGKSIDYAALFPDPKSPSLDHVQPLSKGGSHTLDNCAFVHLVCNLRKGDREAAALPEAALFTI